MVLIIVVNNVLVAIFLIQFQLIGTEAFKFQKGCKSYVKSLIK